MQNPDHLHFLPQLPSFQDSSPLLPAEELDVTTSVAAEVEVLLVLVLNEVAVNTARIAK